MNDTYREVAKGMLLAVAVAALCVALAVGIDVWFPR
jgi:hypothetical protein